MSGFMNDDVVRHAGVNRSTVARFEVTEEQRLVSPRVKGVRVSECVWHELELMPSESPAHPSSEREFEPRERSHDQCVDVLAVERPVRRKTSRIGVLEWIDCRTISILLIGKWRIKRVGRRVEVHDLHPVSPWTGGQLFGWQLDRRSQYSPVAVDNRGILRNYSEVVAAAGGRTHGGSVLRGMGSWSR
jgi:hypothetical protein